MNSKDGGIIDRREMLRVKVKSLAVEARIIRREENRTKGVLRGELWNHRTGVLRQEARLSGLAYGLVRGRKMEQMEQKVREGNKLVKSEIDRINTMIQRYGPVDPKAKSVLIIKQ